MAKGSRVAATLKYLTLLGTLGTCGPSLATSLEQQFADLATCRVDQVYLNPVDQQPSGNYFVERQLLPCDVDEVARYCVNERFHGLTVLAVAIPYRGPFSVHALYFKDDVASVRKRLGPGFDGDGLHQPRLMADRQNPSGSVLYCDPDSQ
jgi:hypothetical protein